MSNQRAITNLIKSISGQANILTIPRIYIDLTGDHVSALFLSQCVYWSDRGQDGWFYKSEKEWKKELGLTPYQIRRCKTKLKPWLQTKLKKANGAPTTHYRVDVGLLTNSIIKKLNNPLLRNLTNLDCEETQQSLTETTTEIKDSSASADKPIESKNQDPLSNYFGNGNGQGKKKKTQAKDKRGSGAPSKKKPTAYNLATEHLARVFANVRGLSANPEFDFDEWYDFSTQKAAKATNKTIKMPLGKIWKSCGKDLEFAERAVREVVKKMRDENLTFSNPAQIVLTFDSWLPDQKSMVSVSMPYDQETEDLPEPISSEKLQELKRNAECSV